MTIDFVFSDPFIISESFERDKLVVEITSPILFVTKEGEVLEEYNTMKEGIPP